MVELTQGDVLVWNGRRYLFQVSDEDQHFFARTHGDFMRLDLTHDELESLIDSGAARIETPQPALQIAFEEVLQNGRLDNIHEGAPLCVEVEISGNGARDYDGALFRVVVEQIGAIPVEVRE